MSDWDFGGAYANTEATLQKTEQTAQAFPLLQQHALATTRLNNAEAGLMEQKLTSEQNLAKIMSGLQIGQNGETQSASIMKMANAAMQAGDGVTARDLLLRASQMHASEAKETQTAAMTQKYKVDAVVKMSDRYNQLLNGVTSQADLDKANFIFQSEFNEPGPLMEYDPRSVGIVQQSTMKLRDKVYADHVAETERLARARLGETQQYHNEIINLRKTGEERRQAAQDARIKNGGKDVGAPQKSEVFQANDLLTREGKLDGLDVAAGRTAAFDLASRAKAMRKQNPGLDAGEAMTRAFAQQVDEGYFAEKQATSLFGRMLGKSTPTYGKPGGSPDKALAVPADRSTMKPQTYYQTPKGRLLYLGGGRWQAPGAAATAPAGRGGYGGGAAAADDSEDNDEED